MIGREDADDRGGRGERTLAWPPGAAGELDSLALELVAGIEAAAIGGRALTLVELERAGAAAAMQLCERLAAHWQAAGLRSLIVDGHPVSPFFGVLFAGNPEGFTEILHYGLSPAAAAQERPHCAGLWIPAGGRWALPLESPDEPALTMSRLLGEAERVLILVDAGNAEGLLAALRGGCHYHLRLAAAATQTSEARPLPTAPAVVTPAPLAPASPPPTPTPTATTANRPAAPAPPRTPRPASPRRAAGRGRWLTLLLPAGALLLVGGLYLITGPWGGDAETSLRSVERGAGDAFSPLPAPVAAPYAAAPGEAGDSAASALAAASETEREPESAAPAIEPAPRGPATAGLATPAGQGLPPAREAATSAPPRATPPAGGPQRRFEAEGAWARLLRAPGPFYIHMESYRDSVLAAEAALAPGARRLGARLAPASVEGVRWYRLWLGPFGELSAAAACRDSLLDRAGEDYCRIVTPSP